MVGMGLGAKNEMAPSCQTARNVTPPAPTGSCQLGTHVALHMALLQLRHSCRCWQLCWIQLCPEETCWDVFRGYSDYWSIFNNDQLCFNFLWRSSLLLLFFPCLSNFSVSLFQVFPFTPSTWLSADCHDSLSHSLHQELSPKVILW